MKRETQVEKETRAAEAKLSAEDMERVNRYLESPIHTVERKPFRPYAMMLGLVGVVTLLSLFSLLIASLVLE